MSADNPAVELNQLETLMRLPDAIMEPGILAVLRRYVSDGGNPATVVEMLSDNYHGYAQMASLVVSWSSLLDMEGAPPGPDPTTRDEPYFLRELIKQRFDPDKFSGIFTRGGSGPPKWLDGLTADPAGRQLIYQLSAHHRNSLLLNFAIQKILRAGHEDEVASVGASLASYFGVFHRLMTNRLKEVPTADAARLRALTAELKETACSGQHTYCHAQQVLAEVGRRPGAARFRRLQQELEAAAAEQHGAIAWQMQAWFMARNPPAGDTAAAGHVADLCSAAPGSSRGVAAVAELYTLYTQADPPRISLIRHPKVMELLIAKLFTPGRRVPPEEAQTHRGLLAIAAAAIDKRPEGELDTSDVERVEGAVKDAMGLCRVAAAGAKLGPGERAQVDAVADVAVAAAGMLQAMKALLGTADYWRDTLHTSGAHIFIYLLGLVIDHHPLLSDKAVSVLESTLVAMGNKELELQKALVDCTVRLLLAGNVEPCLKLAERWARNADQSVTRHLVRRLLSTCAPPYSPAFASAVLKLMQTSGVRRHRTAQHDGISLEQLDEFAGACARLKDFQGQLTASERAYLTALQG